MAIDPKTAARDLMGNRKALIGVAVALLVLVLAWVFWPSGKPPEPCPNGARPGQLVQDFDRQTGQVVQKLMGSDCKPALSRIQVAGTR